MAMRQRSGGVSNTTRPRQTYRPSYEDFQPQFELKEEHEAHFIHVHLPGFVKEQVRITFLHSPGVIRVHGQRPLGNNKWSRFDQTYPLPQNCDSSKIHGKFHNGILTITLPKEVTTQTGPKEVAAAKPIQEPPTALPKTSAAAEAKPKKPAVEAKVQKGQDAIHQTAIATAAAAAARDEKQRDKISVPSKDPQVTASEPKARRELPLREGIAETKEQKDKEAGVPPNVVSAMTQQRDEKRVIPLTSPSPQNAASEPKSQKGRDEIPPKAMADYQKEIQNKYISEANEKPGEPKNAEKVVETPLQNEKEMTGGRSTEAAVFAPNTLDKAKKKSEQFGSGVEQEKPKEDSIAAKQGKKNLGNWMNNEETQMLINVGAAVLVLLAFGAYSTYNFLFSGKPKN